MRLGLRHLPLFCRCLAISILACSPPAQAESENSASEKTQDVRAPFSAEDELIFELQIEGEDRADTIIAYGRLPEVYLPVGLISRLLDVAISVSDDGSYAEGWVIQERNTFSLEAGKLHVTRQETEIAIQFSSIVSFDGEMYVLPDVLEAVLPIEVEVDLRAQSIHVRTLEKFPFQSQRERDLRRGLLSVQSANSREERFTRVDDPYELFRIPMADLELRGASDGTRGTRIEGELYLAGDIAATNAEFFVSAASNDGFTAALFEAGRDDPDGGLLGPMGATSFAVGDVQTAQQPIGLRSSFGRGLRIANSRFDAGSVFDEIDLRGVLQDGYEVELYRNGILLDSTDNSTNGQYEFLRVPVDFGINSFRLVFYGPQGQQREEVRTLRIGDGRLPKGQLNYELGVVQNDRTLLNVRPSGAVIPLDSGDWRAIANVAYGVSSSLTVVSSASFQEDNRFDQSTIGTIGVRTGFSSTGLRFDAGFSSGGGFAAVVGLNGRVGGTSFTVNHGEYANGFIDEQRAPSSRPLVRATDLNVTTSIKVADDVFIPVIGRARRLAYADGGYEMRVGIRASTRLMGFLASNSLEYAEFKVANGFGDSQLLGSFDVSTVGAGQFKLRSALEYELMPKVKPTAISAVADYRLSEKTNLRASSGYRLDGTSLSVGTSASTMVGKGILALEADYDLKRKAHSVALRWGLSFGRNSGGFYVDRPSRAKQGAVEVHAFYDRNADGVQDPDEGPLENLTFFSPSESVETDETGHAMITGLPSNRPVNIQVDIATIPDITLVPQTSGFQIVPRRGHLQSIAFPIVSVGEIDGTVSFVTSEGEQPVGGVTLGLKPQSEDDAIVWVRSEADGYFYFEQVRPGRYSVVLDEGQASRLQLCLEPASDREVVIASTGGQQTVGIKVQRCPESGV